MLSPRRLPHVLVLCAACAASPEETLPEGSELPAPEHGFQISSPLLELRPGTESTYCYYFRMPNTETVGVKQWRSLMTPGSHHMILYFTSTELAPEGTLTSKGCGGGLGVWAYAAQTPEQTFTMPPQVGMTVEAGQPAFLQMHYLNATDHPRQVRVNLNAETYAAAETYTPASAYVTYNSNISVPPGTPAAPGTASAGGLCTVSPDAKFFSLSTHVHKQGTRTQVLDGATMVFEATDWEHPGARTFEAPYYSFGSGGLNYRCEYKNPTSRVIADGDSAELDEMCMAIGYFFPAQKAIFCLNNTVVPR